MNKEKVKKEATANVEVVEIPLSKLNEPTFILRSSINEKTLQELANSIDEVGVLEPALVVKVKGGHEIVAGHRRYLACELLKRKRMPCIVVKADSLEIDVMKLHENLYRDGLSVLDEGRMFQYMIEQLHISGNEVAKRIRKSENYVHQRLSLLMACPALQRALESGEIGFTVARELSQISDEEVQAAYVHAAINGGCSEATARMWRREWEVSQVPAVEQTSGTAPYSAIEPVGEQKYRCELCNNTVSFEHMRTIHACEQCDTALKEAKKEVE